MTIVCVALGMVVIIVTSKRDPWVTHRTAPSNHVRFIRLIGDVGLKDLAGLAMPIPVVRSNHLSLLHDHPLLTVARGKEELVEVLVAAVRIPLLGEGGSHWIPVRRTRCGCRPLQLVQFRERLAGRATHELPAGTNLIAAGGGVPGRHGLAGTTLRPLSACRVTRARTSELPAVISGPVRTCPCKHVTAQRQHEQAIRVKVAFN